MAAAHWPVQASTHQCQLEYVRPPLGHVSSLRCRQYARAALGDSLKYNSRRTCDAEIRPVYFR
ncbi:hypothetical protein XFF6960_120044 [Xanthomonas citri pv. fuscans]|nr:hypothetical protein XFF6960_120044 [Xanthomonas citri pv. fuscans]